MVSRGYVLVGGWPASGKTTLSRELATRLDLPWLSKDEVKLALADALGTPGSVEESRRLGRAAVVALLAVARGCPGAVLDSTWFPSTMSLVRELPARCVEVRCHVPVEVARARYSARLGDRDPRHLDGARTEDELWGAPVAPLGIGPLVDVDTSGPVDVGSLAARIAGLLSPG